MCIRHRAVDVGAKKRKNRKRGVNPFFGRGRLKGGGGRIFIWWQIDRLTHISRPGIFIGVEAIAPPPRLPVGLTPLTEDSEESDHSLHRKIKIATVKLTTPVGYSYL